MIETIIFPKKKYTVQECCGELTTYELLETASSFFSSTHTPNVIWDFSLAQLVNISPNAIKQLVFIWSEQNTRWGGGKIAIVAPLDLQYTFSMIFESVPELEKANFETKIVSSLGEAKEWFSE